MAKHWDSFLSHCRSNTYLLQVGVTGSAISVSQSLMSLIMLKITRYDKGQMYIVETKLIWLTSLVSCLSCLYEQSSHLHHLTWFPTYWRYKLKHVEQVIYASYTSWASSSMNSFDFAVFGLAGRPRGRPDELLDLAAAARFGGISDDKCRGANSKDKQTEQGSESDWDGKVLQSFQIYKGSQYTHEAGQGGSVVCQANPK